MHPTASSHAAGPGHNHRSRQVLLVALLLLSLASALAVIRSSHHCRQLYAQLQQLEADQWYLHEDYGRLLLEQSTWASHYRVERVAKRELDMQPPPLQELKVVRQ
ncbi:cell division protein FtsL [Kineobactrum salinum]|uniref:Cell division protein FtsL n=1 Tax=Kineobactrum salinum TaxID=2708301 RepID=A0A6C0UC70_9GAMM|nr:cell division protein FtsL [Kineobactrum salinum]